MDQPINSIDRIIAIMECDGLDALTEAELGLFAVYWFVLETNGGGIHPFFYNDSGQFALPALRYLERIGAVQTASILRRAIALFPNGEVPILWGQRQDEMIALDDCNISFDRLTDELFSCSEDVDALHQAYASAHPNRFERVRGGSQAS